MPEYAHRCNNEECKNEWEDTYSIKKDPPTECPKCHQQTAERLISLNGKSVVELTGNELREKVLSDAKAYKAELGRNEKAHASFVGEAKYEAIQSSMDRSRRR